MSKIVLAVLTVAAFLYAAWLVLFRRQLPDPKQTTGLKRRFILATLLFVGLFGIIPASAAKKKPPRPTCYKPASMRVVQPGACQQLAITLKAVWRTLDPARAQEFRDKLQKAAGDKVIRKKTADMLAIAYADVAYHKKRTRGKGRKMTCYDMTMEMSASTKPRENILKQIELLQKARKSGSISEKSSKRAMTALSREIEMLYRAKGKDSRYIRKLLEEYNQDKLTAGDSATIAAKLIVEMEDGKITDLTPPKRMATMKDRVETLLDGGKKSHLRGGPVGNDWMDPYINPNVHAILEKAGLVSVKPTVPCYSPLVSRVKERGEELKVLQQKLLDENVKAGVLDVEVAEKAASATDVPEIEYATEADIRDYQKKIRRVMRMLYKHGELPSSFVKKIERAADIEIISFNSTKALRNDVRWHLQSSLWDQGGDDILKLLEQRKLVDPARNHRSMMDWPGRGNLNISDNENERISRLKILLDSSDKIELKGDGNTIIKKYQLPSADLEYRLQVRRACRVLIKDGFVKPDQLKALEEVIGIPVVGTIEK